MRELRIPYLVLLYLQASRRSSTRRPPRGSKHHGTGISLAWSVRFISQFWSFVRLYIARQESNGFEV
jgi:hypothetical protein